ncbi:hypothetical protein GCM10023322_33550 [Rugosimonospora acidiphila]|uniref:Ankyrin repeat domain-containing protein n=1 Tax=Rugosimonospora acidiphila TaxID=556531 RepID=A0ABP9RUB3_9ACTN
MAYPALIDLVLHSPGRAAATSALGTLRALALDRDLAAVLALATVVAEQLQPDGPPVPDVAVPADLVNAEMPAIARAYALGYYPWLLVDQGLMLPDRYSERAGDAGYDRAFRRFQSLVERDTPTQHEALRAMLLDVLAYRSLVLDHTGYSLSAQLHSAAQQMAASARVVDGRNMDTTFEVGREVIRHSSGAFAGAALHEVGHHISSRREGGSTARTVDALEAALPAMLDTAQGLIGQPWRGHDDPRRHELSDGLTVLCSRDRIAGTVCTHLSFSANGAIRLTAAARCALRALRVFGVAPSRVATAYSDRGVFHVGFADEPVPGGSATPASDSAADATRWLDELWREGRFGRDETDLYRAIGLHPPRSAFYSDDVRHVEDIARLMRLRSEDAPETPDPDELLALGVRCGDPAATRLAIERGARGEHASPLLRELGIVTGALRTTERILCLSSNADACRSTLIQLRGHGLDLDAAIDARGGTLLTDAASRDADLVTFLLDLGADLDHPAGAGVTPLLAAIDADQIEVAARLIEAGARTDRADAEGRTPLHMACRRGHPSIAWQLLAHGADLDAPTHAGLTPLMEAVDAGHSLLTSELLDRGADPDAATALGVTALHLAVVGPAEVAGDTVRALIAAGADVDEETNDGRTPLDLAERHGRAELAALLGAAGALAGPDDGPAGSAGSAGSRRSAG